MPQSCICQPMLPGLIFPLRSPGPFPTAAFPNLLVHRHGVIELHSTEIEPLAYHVCQPFARLHYTFCLDEDFACLAFKLSAYIPLKCRNCI